MDYPVSIDENGVNLKPEKMEKEKLYHCIFKNKVILVFKDSQDWFCVKCSYTLIF